MFAFMLTGSTPADVVLIGGCLVFVAVYFGYQARDASRPCPRCGSRVKTQVMTCPSCGFDFETIGRTDDGPRR